MATEYLFSLIGKNLSSLKTLNLSHTDIKPALLAYSDLSGLEVLDLSYLSTKGLKLEDFTSNFNKMKSLKVLKLKGDNSLICDSSFWINSIPGHVWETLELIELPLGHTLTPNEKVSLRGVRIIIGDHEVDRSTPLPITQEKPDRRKTPSPSAMVASLLAGM